MNWVSALFVVGGGDGGVVLMQSRSAKEEYSYGFYHIDFVPLTLEATITIQGG